MKKMIIAFLAVTLVFSLIGCDAMLNVMDKMSNNVAGTEKKVIEDAVNAATPAPSGKPDGTLDTGVNFTQGEGEDAKVLLSIKKTDEKKSEVTIGGKIPLEVSNDFAQQLVGIESIITPTDISATLNGLKASGSNSSEIEAALKQPVVDEDTQKAAAGTKQIISAIVEVSKVFEPKTPSSENPTQSEIDEIEEYNKKITEVKKKVEDILNPDAEVTKADVVVLTAITNIVFNEEIADSILAMKDAENEDDEKKAADAFQSATINEAMKLLDVVAYVPSDMVTGVLDVVNMFIPSSSN